MSIKKNNKVQNNVQNQQVNNNGCQHVQLGGIAYYDDKQYFLFSPDSVNQGVVEAFRRHGVAQQMQDGTFDFIAVSKPKSQSELIKKLAHGRVSKTKDGAIQLTLKVFFHEGLNIARTLAVESAEGVDALVDYQLKR
nr:hypothetical protein [uncultured Prevotella sp.]